MSKEIVREALELCNSDSLPQSNKKTNKKSMIVFLQQI